MSVQQESPELTQSAAETRDASEEDYGAVRTDSLVMFGAALGGALVGMLLTLMVLALINGGTLNFSGGARQIAAFEANLARINDNVGAISSNVDIVADHANSLEQDLAAAQADLQSQLESQSDEISGINASLDTLDVTQQQFDLFMGALSTALTDMETVGEPAQSGTIPAASEVTEGDAVEENAPTDAGEAAAEEAETAADATDAVELPLPLVQTNADLAPDSLVVLFFADADTDGTMNDDETNLVGMSVSLLNDDGESVASAVSGDAGAVIEGLDAGSYRLVVDDSLGYDLLSQREFDIALDASDGGTVVMIPVGTSAP